MAPTSRPEGQLKLNLSSLSPIAEPGPTASTKSPFSSSKSTNTSLANLNLARGGAGSPLHEQTSRLFPKRTRELATPTAVSSNIWGPPTSGTSTPLFEIPESPDHDGFPDLIPVNDTTMNSPARRARAGTLPSRISPVGTINGIHALTSKTSRPTPSTSPFRPSSTSTAENAFNAAPGTSPSSSSSNSALLSRLRAGSMPQKGSLLSSGGSFGQSPFSSWNSRSRAATLTSIHSADETLSSPQPGFPKDGLTDPAVRTLGYLGLAETSLLRENDLSSLHSIENHQQLSNTASGLGANRFRSFSVNTQPKSGAASYENGSSNYPLSASGAMTPSAQAALEAQYQAVQERVRQHNQAVQAFALNTNAARPRARTAGIVEAPQRTLMRKFGYGDAETEADLTETQMLNMTPDPNMLADSFYDLNLRDANQPYDGQDDIASQISRSLWIGSIPNSTTVSSLDAIFAQYGPIESTRVLTHKNCGFVNYENVQDAVRARQILNGKEIFPGGGPVRIGFAKAPNNVPSAQVPFSRSSPINSFADQSNENIALIQDSNTGAYYGQINREDADTIATPTLMDLRADALKIVGDFGAHQSDLVTISTNIDNAQAYNELASEISPISEPRTNRVYDAPRLRDIRKRIDNGSCGMDEIEHVAIDMLPEITELSSDYLGNTVVQKLFEYCSEPVKEQMLAEIAPHLAEIGIHKNGTWAAQKIIEVCKSESQIRLIVETLRPYTIPLFLDQYGNYVLQCCLKFGQPYNDFIFETMTSHLWEISQGRFGARAMRACLESHHASKNQQRMIAAVIALHSVKLAINTNAALLLTWLLDTCTFPKRRSALAPRLLPHLIQLCTHKVAYLTVLKVVNQRNEPEAREQIVQALFFNVQDNILEQILSDQASGVTLIFKILTNPFLDESVRPEVLQKVASALEKIKAQPNQGYKRLMDEVGLSSRPVQPAMQSFTPHHLTQQKGGQGVGNMQYPSYLNGVPAQGFADRPGQARTTSNESFGYPTYPVNNYQASNGYGNLPYHQMTPQDQYNNYPSQIRGNNTYMNSNFAGYSSPPLTVDALRGLQNSGSPIGYSAQMSPMLNAGSFTPQGYAQPTGNMYNFHNAPAQQSGYYFNPGIQSVPTNNRGRRVR